MTPDPRLADSSTSVRYLNGSQPDWFAGEGHQALGVVDDQVSQDVRVPRVGGDPSFILPADAADGTTLEFQLTVTDREGPDRHRHPVVTVDSTPEATPSTACAGTDLDARTQWAIRRTRQIGITVSFPCGRC